MATNTTRLGLIKPDFVDVVDVAQLNSNADDIDAAVGAAVVTSATRPSSPWAGQIIHETDTDKTLVWDGVAWVETGAADLDDLGDVTVTSAASGDQLVYNGSAWVNRPEAGDNLLFNGAMQVHQRGTSTTGITTQGYYTADRWKIELSSLGTWTQTVENDAPTGSGFRKSFKMLCTTADAAPAAGDYLTVRQYLEGQDLQSIKKGTSFAQVLMLSFWVKSNTTGTYIAHLYDGDNTRMVSIAYTVSASATWEKKTITFPADTTGAFDNDNAGSLYIDFWLGVGTDRSSGTLQTTWAAAVNANTAVGQTNLAASTNNYWQITGVQLEVGPVATPFEFKPFGVELAECQRYYRRIRGDEGNLGTSNALGLGTFYSSGLYRAVNHFPVKMRALPVFTATNSSNSYTIVGNGSVLNYSTVTLDFASQDSAVLAVAVSGATQGTSGWLQTSAAGVFVAFDAEL
jgi:hypothetical protein